jgi:hypothetical protein
VPAFGGEKCQSLHLLLEAEVMTEAIAHRCLQEETHCQTHTSKTRMMVALTASSYGGTTKPEMPYGVP